MHVHGHQRAAETRSLSGLPGLFLQHVIHSQMFPPPNAAVMCDPHSWPPQPVIDKMSPELRKSQILILVFAINFDKLYFRCLFVSGASISLALK